MEFVARHIRGDFGEVCEEDREANEDAVRHGERLLSRVLPRPQMTWTAARSSGGGASEPRTVLRDERALIAKLNNPMPPSTQVAGSGTGTTVSRKGLVAEWTGSEPTSTPALEYFKIEDEPDPTT